MDPALIVFIIAILIVATVAWKEFGGGAGPKAAAPQVAP